MDAKHISNEVQVLKVDVPDKVVYGFAIICKSDGEEYYDVQGDHIPEEVMRKSATEFMLSARAAKEMHVGITKGVIVHSMPLTEELIKSLGIENYNKTGWLIGMRCNDEQVLHKFAKKEYTGFSIAGTANKTIEA